MCIDIGDFLENEEYRKAFRPATHRDRLSDILLWQMATSMAQRTDDLTVR